MKLKALEHFFIIAAILSVVSLYFDILDLGVIWAIVFALMFGSFATSFVSRIPLKIMHKKRDPYCMNCNSNLKWHDLYTIFSYILTLGKCRYCNALIPKEIFITESLVTFLFILAYFLHGFSLQYIILSLLFFFYIISWILWFKDHFIAKMPILLTMCFLLIYILIT
jgi:leader peptidase (prepilin peptidase)/N-methyltransferase